MRAVVQRVSRASVIVDDHTVASIGSGLLILTGIGLQDDPDKARELAGKIARLRIFSDPGGKMNLSLLDTGGSALVVSQFTLFADTRKGNRPSFTDAMPPEPANQLVNYFVKCLQEEGLIVHQGVFGAHMVAELVNDGPVTINLEN